MGGQEPCRLHNTQPGGIGSLESILGLLERIKIRALSERLSANAKAATVLGSILASFDTVESEVRQMEQC
jgi:hypothetical protein